MRIALSGTGRIGRLVLRRLLSSSIRNLELCAVNSTVPPVQLAHLLKYDSVHGIWDLDVTAGEQAIVVGGRTIPVLSERDPRLLPWASLGADLVIDATGKFTDREGASRHLIAGAGKVIVTSPGKDLDLTVVMGVNEEAYRPGEHVLISAASCTTNCISPLLRILDEAYGVEDGWMSTVHSYTNDQNHVDNPHKDLRRARSCTTSIVPTTTGVSKALAGVLPHLAPRIKGVSIRVPTPDVSLLDLQVKLRKPAALEEVKETFRKAAQGPLGRYVDYNELPLVSADYRGNEKSAVVDGLSMLEKDGQIKLLAWYDNEWGYSCRVVDLAVHIANKVSKNEEAVISC